MSDRPVFYLGSSEDDLKEMPIEVQRTIQVALVHAQLGGKHPKATPMKGFGGASVLEVRVWGIGGTYRAMYTVRFKEAVYVLHAFHKKSKHGKETPAKEISIVKARLKEAELDHAIRYGGNDAKGKKTKR